MSRLDRAKTAFEVLKLAVDVWVLIDERWSKRKQQEERIAALESEVAKLKKEP